MKHFVLCDFGCGMYYKYNIEICERMTTEVYEIKLL